MHNWNEYTHQKLRELRLRASKKSGQNFLIHYKVINKILNSTTIDSSDFSINLTGYIFFGNIRSLSQGNYLRYHPTGSEVSYLSSSDIRLKENIKLWEPDSLSFLVAQDLIKFDRKDGSNYGEIGWNANQMSDLMPDMTWIGEDGYYNLKDAHFPLHFHRAIKQLNQKIEELEAEIESLKN